MTAIDAALSVALGGDDDRSRRFIRSALPLAVIRDRRPSAAIQIGRVLRVGRGRVLAADGESGGRFFAQRSSQAGIRPNRGAAPAFQARRHPSTCREPTRSPLVDRGHGREAEVRRTTVEGIVDTGAVSLVIPEEVANELGLTRPVVYADERRDQRPVGRGVTIEIGSLATETERIIGGERGADRPGRARGSGPGRRLHEADGHAAASGRASAGPAMSPARRVGGGSRATAQAGKMNPRGAPVTIGFRS